MTILKHQAHARHSDHHSTHVIRRCKFCRERFGTLAALELHKPRPADTRSRQLRQTGIVRRSRCASERTMLRGGAWRGHGGVWWTVDGGWSDATEGRPIVALQVIENKSANLDKIGTLTSAIPEIKESHNGAGFSGSLSKFRGTLQ